MRNILSIRWLVSGYKNQVTSARARWVCLLSCGTLIASCWSGFAGQGGLSRNIVGFHKIGLPSNSTVMASIPFHDFGTNTAISFVDVFRGQLRNGFLPSAADAVYMWDEVAQSYQIFWKAYFGDQWRLSPGGTETTNRVPVYQGMLILNRHADQEVYLFGEVPSEGTAPTTTVTLTETYQLAGYPYPSGIGLNETTLTDISGTETGDLIRLWDIPGQDYVHYFYDETGTNGGGWQLIDSPGSPTARRLRIGEGFWFSQTNNGTGNHDWTESKPYTWP